MADPVDDPPPPDPQLVWQVFVDAAGAGGFDAAEIPKLRRRNAKLIAKVSQECQLTLEDWRTACRRHAIECSEPGAERWYALNVLAQPDKVLRLVEMPRDPIKLPSSRYRKVEEPLPLRGQVDEEAREMRKHRELWNEGMRSHGLYLAHTQQIDCLDAIGPESDENHMRYWLERDLLARGWTILDDERRTIIPPPDLNPGPSQEDLELAEQLEAFAKTLGTKRHLAAV